MKKIIFSIISLSALLLSCGKDNYKEPTAVIEGKVSYNGASVGVRGTNEVIQLQLYQDGYQLKGHIPVYVKQDGSFSAKVFDGKYKLVARSNNGPWLNASSDTLVVDVKTKATVNYEVTPYFTIGNADIKLGSNKSIQANFVINKVVPAANVQYYSLIISRTAFVDDAVNVWRKEYPYSQQNTITLAEDLSSLAQMNDNSPLYARVGVRSNLSEQSVYSEVIKIK